MRGMLKSFFNAKRVVKKAIDDLSFTIQEGEIVGYIGANGAGKSTTIKILSGILTPTKGNVLVNGIVPYKERVKNAYNIGVVFGQRTQLWWDLPLQESFSILKEIYSIPDQEFDERFKFYDDLLGISEFIKSPVRNLSLGERMRADIVASLMHNPKILFLDEPTIGLDVVAKQKMREAIKVLNKKYQTTIILTTHDLDDIAELCHRIMIIDSGKIIYEGTLNDIKDNFGFMKTVEFATVEPIQTSVDLSSLNLPQEDLNYEIKDRKLILRYNKHKVTVATIAGLIMAQFKVADMTVSEQNIETLVGNIYQRKIKV